jgi:plasmid stabilization system protein ParE
MKARAIVLIDYTFPNGIVEAAEEQKRLTDGIKSLLANNPRVATYQVDLRERRGSGAPDIKKLKLRTS